MDGILNMSLKVGKQERRTKIQMRTSKGGQKDRNTNEDVDKGTKGQKYN